MLKVVRSVLYFSTQSFNASKNYYKILNVEEGASPQAIKKSYKNLAKRYHPDFNKGKQDDFKEVNEAYQVLSDQNTKMEYDQVRSSGNRYQNVNQGYHDHQHHQNTTYNYDPRYPGDQQWRNQGNQQNTSYQYRSGPQGYQQYYFYGNPKKQNQQSNTWNSREKILYEFYRQQQADFMNRYHQSQRQRFDRQGQGNYRSPIEEEYMRRFMDDLAARQEEKRTREQQRAERQNEEKLQRQRLQRQYEESKRKIKEMTGTLGRDIRDFFKGVWNAYLELKGKK